MAQAALGTKRHCQSCGERYYDLDKSPIICPLCETPFDPEVRLRSSRLKLEVIPKDEPKPATPEEPAIEGEAIAPDLEDEAVGTNDSEILEDDDLIKVKSEEKEDESEITPSADSSDLNEELGASSTEEVSDEVADMATEEPSDEVVDEPVDESSEETQDDEEKS